MDQLLLESGDKLLLENGDFLLLESGAIDPDSNADWNAHRQPDRFPAGLAVDRLLLLRTNPSGSGRRKGNA